MTTTKTKTHRKPFEIELEIMDLKDELHEAKRHHDPNADHWTCCHSRIETPPNTCLLYTSPSPRDS